MSPVLYYLYQRLVMFSSLILVSLLLQAFLLIKAISNTSTASLFFVTTPVVPSVTLYFALLPLVQLALNLNSLLLMSWINNDEKLLLFFITPYFCSLFCTGCSVGCTGVVSSFFPQMILPLAYVLLAHSFELLAILRLFLVLAVFLPVRLLWYLCFSLV